MVQLLVGLLLLGAHEPQAVQPQAHNLRRHRGNGGGHRQRDGRRIWHVLQPASPGGTPSRYCKDYSLIIYLLYAAGAENAHSAQPEGCQRSLRQRKERHSWQWAPHLDQKEAKLVTGRPPAARTSQGSYRRSPLKLWQCTFMPSMAALTSLSRTSDMGSYRWLKKTAWCSTRAVSLQTSSSKPLSCHGLPVSLSRPAIAIGQWRPYHCVVLWRMGIGRALAWAPVSSTSCMRAILDSGARRYTMEVPRACKSFSSAFRL